MTITHIQGSDHERRFSFHTRRHQKTARVFVNNTQEMILTMSEESGAFGGGGGFEFDVVDKLSAPPPSFEQFLLMQAYEDEAQTLPPMYTSTVMREAEPGNEEEKQRSSSIDSSDSNVSSSSDSERHGQQQPTKKLKYDKLGRLTAVEEVKPVVPLASTLAAGSGNKLKRPRGRPPKGKIWDDKRGWIDEGLGLGPRRKLY